MTKDMKLTKKDPNKPLVDGVRDKVVIKPIADLQDQFKTLQENIVTVSGNQLQMIQQISGEINKIKGNVEVLDTLMTAFKDILIEKEIITGEEYLNKVGMIANDKLDLMDMREDQAQGRTVVDRESKVGDVVRIDYEGFVDDELFEGGSSVGFNLLLGSKSFIGTFEDQLVGKKAGDEVEVKVTAPDNFPENLKNKELTFKVKVRQVKEIKKD